MTFTSAHHCACRAVTGTCTANRSTVLAPGASTVLRFAVHVPMTERHAQWWALVKVMYYGRVRYTEAVPVVIGPVN